MSSHMPKKNLKGTSENRWNARRRGGSRAHGASAQRGEKSGFASSETSEPIKQGTVRSCTESKNRRSRHSSTRFSEVLKILILDNYDSFTYNLAQYFQELVTQKRGKVVVYKNNEKTVAEIAAEKPTHIVISPGPGTPQNPEDIGICLDVIKKFASPTGTQKIPILGVCLGHQMIAHFYGADIIEAPEIVHGKTSQIVITEFSSKKSSKKSRLFEGIPQKFSAMRYHSLVVDEKSFPGDLRITARTSGTRGRNVSHERHETDRGLIMALEHKKFPIYGIQFHPESFATQYGKKILANFLKYTGQRTGFYAARTQDDR